jgi:hypothetical protein
MRLADLSPNVRQIMKATTQHPVMMAPTEDWELSFWCPRCGKPFACSILLGESVREEEPRRWQATPMPGATDWFERVTITPSINYTVAAHGPKKPACAFHGSIVDGFIVP